METVWRAFTTWVLRLAPSCRTDFFLNSHPRISDALFVCVVLRLELRVFTLSYSTSPIFVKGFLR
jgi:hypothetical protein